MSGLQAGFLAFFVGAILLVMFYKPTRFWLTWINGVSCPAKHICVENEDTLPEAERLYKAALRNLQPKLGGFLETPRVIFCSSWDCYDGFGMTEYPVQSYGDSATVISPDGWEDYHVARGLVHRWVTQHLGWFRKLFLPTWLEDGMAYELSGDPRNLLEPYRTYKTKFRAWYQQKRGRELKLEIRREARLF